MTPEIAYFSALTLLMVSAHQARVCLGYGFDLKPSLRSLVSAIGGLAAFLGIICFGFGFVRFEWYVPLISLIGAAFVGAILTRPFRGTAFPFPISLLSFAIGAPLVYLYIL